MATIDEIRGTNRPQTATPPPGGESAADAGPAAVAYKAPSLAEAARLGSGSRDAGDDGGLGGLEQAYHDYKGKRQADLGSLNAALDRMAGKHRPMSDAELAKERKRRRRDAIFAAIGDGVSALSNLYFTTRYAPDAHRPGKMMSEGMKQRWDKLDKERDEGMKQYLDILMQKYRLGKEAGGEDLAWARVFADMKQRRRPRSAPPRR